MSYITSIPLNRYRQGTKKILVSRQVAHATVSQAFHPSELEGEKGRILWRLDTDGISTNLIIVSPTKPSPEHIIEQCGWSSSEVAGWDTVEYDGVINHINDGDRYEFSVALNTVVVDAASNKRVAVKKEDLDSWIEYKLKEAGVSSDSIQVNSYRSVNFMRGGKKVTLAIAEISGAMTVLNSSKLTDALLYGIGKAKGYGCGLLTLDNQIL